MPPSLDYDERFFEAVREIRPDAVFNALHGPGGEDGHIQALLEYVGIPYTGSAVEASSLSMDKHLTKKLLAAEGLPTAAWDLFDLSGGTLPLLPGSLDLPLVVKPRFEGSSAGVTIVRTHEQWTAAMLAASKSFGQILAEEYVEGREFTCAVLGEEALPVVEIVANRDGFYSFDAKYEPGGSTHVVPAQIDADLAARLQMLALSDASAARIARLLAYRLHRQRRPAAVHPGNQLAARPHPDQSFARRVRRCRDYVRSARRPVGRVRAGAGRRARRRRLVPSPAER